MLKLANESDKLADLRGQDIAHWIHFIYTPLPGSKKNGDKKSRYSKTSRKTIKHNQKHTK